MKLILLFLLNTSLLIFGHVDDHSFDEDLSVISITDFNTGGLDGADFFQVQHSVRCFYGTNTDMGNNGFYETFNKLYQGSNSNGPTDFTPQGSTDAERVAECMRVCLLADHDGTFARYDGTGAMSYKHNSGNPCLFFHFQMTSGKCYFFDATPCPGDNIDYEDIGPTLSGNNADICNGVEVAENTQSSCTAVNTVSNSCGQDSACSSFGKFEYNENIHYYRRIITQAPTTAPTSSPSTSPTLAPTPPTASPTNTPTTPFPTTSPTDAPTTIASRCTDNIPNNAIPAATGVLANGDECGGNSANGCVRCAAGAVCNSASDCESGFNCDGICKECTAETTGQSSECPTGKRCSSLFGCEVITTSPTASPTDSPTQAPTGSPTKSPTPPPSPTMPPTKSPTNFLQAPADPALYQNLGWTSETYNSVDTNNDGVVSLSEWNAYVASTPPPTPPPTPPTLPPTDPPTITVNAESTDSESTQQLLAIGAVGFVILAFGALISGIFARSGAGQKNVLPGGFKHKVGANSLNWRYRKVDQA